MKLKRDKYMLEDEFRRLLYAARTRPHVNAPRDLALLATAGLCGLRVGETVSLRLRDCSGLKREPPTIEVRTLKQKSPTLDEVSVPATAARALKVWVRILTGTSGLSTVTGQESDDPDRLVFKLSRRRARGLFKHYAHLAGLNSKLSFHSLRHFRGVQLYSAHRDIQLVKESLRHRRISSTEVYVVAVNALERAAKTDVTL